MSATDQEFQKALLATFMVQAKEHVDALAFGLVTLEQEPVAQKREEMIETIYREAHSLKGAARAVNFLEMEGVCQSLEGELSDLKERGETPLLEEFDRLHQKVDSLADILARAAAEAVALEAFPTRESRDAEAQSQSSAPESAPLPAQPVDGKSTQPTSRAWTDVPNQRLPITDTVRVSTFKVDSLLQEAEELIPAKVAGAHRLSQLRDIQAALFSLEEEWKKARPGTRALQRFLDGQVNGGGKPLSQFGNILPHLLRNESAVQSIRSQLAAFRKNLESDARALERKVAALVTDARRLSMLPFSSLLGAFPKLVRDLCRDCGKNVELLVEGSDIEVDRRVLEEIKDPLIHLVRNCIDHGIEPPHQRALKQKAPKARIAISFQPQGGNKVEIVVRDDGVGVDPQKVRTAAVTLGLVPEAHAHELSDRESVALVFQSGLSTSPMITEVSGRGLGLAIVREKVERLGGSVSLETKPDAGTAVRLVVPLTMATFRGMLVRVGQQVFVLPSMYVHRVLRVDPGGLKTVGNQETVQLDGRAISLVRLGNILGIGDKTSRPDTARKMPAVLLARASEQIAFLVDEVLNEQEIIVKSLGKQLVRVRNIQGATILVTGQVAAVLNVADLFRSVTIASASFTPAEEKPKSIMVAEDSITARTLLKNVLESGGYRVKSAADGAEAFTALQAEPFDLLLSDVDMPKLNGFDLTAKVRADRGLSDLPVVLLTALEAAEDRERGLDVGANAYIVKSSFDQSNLLEVVRKLL